MDMSNGYEAVAEQFMAVRSNVGCEVVSRWAASLPPKASIIDIGAGSGQPLTTLLVDAGLDVSAIDAAPAMVAAFQEHFPDIDIICEAAETSRFFGRKYEGAMAIGLMFLLPAADQANLISNVSEALKPGGKFLFSAPKQVHKWIDVLTGQQSVSLGERAYIDLLRRAKMDLIAQHVDRGENHYYEAQRL